MDFDIDTYRKMVDDFFLMMEFAADIASVKLSADKWTLAEMVGHLIDSASNNHQRFIRLQLESTLAFPAYDVEDYYGHLAWHLRLFGERIGEICAELASRPL